MRRLVRKGGVEPPRPFGHRILSPARLPVPPLSHVMHTVAFDFSGLDHLNPGNGQYRYCIDLLRALSRIPSAFRFLVIGSQPHPPQKTAEVFATPEWRYVHLPRLSMRGAYYFDHVRFAQLLRRERIDVFHTPHTFVPFPISWQTVVTVYDLMSEMFPEYRERVVSRPYRRFRQAVQDRRTHVIAISETTAADLNITGTFRRSGSSPCRSAPK